MQSSEKITINALLQNELQDYIKNLGLEKQLASGELKCEICDEVLGLESIGVIYFENHIPKFTCGKPLCYQTVQINNKE